MPFSNSIRQPLGIHSKTFASVFGTVIAQSKRGGFYVCGLNHSRGWFRGWGVFDNPRIKQYRSLDKSYLINPVLLFFYPFPVNI
jgi:hypothetical protein